MLRAQMKAETVIGSAYWATYLLCNCADSLSDSEIRWADKWLADNGLERAEFVDVGEPYFSWAYGFHTGLPVAGGDLVEYTYLKAV